jgi:two-component system response regulator DesR
MAAEHEPDVVLMDVQMPGEPGLEDGIAATARIMAQRLQTRVIILTTFGRPGYRRRAMESGAVGYMVKDAPADRLVEGIRRVYSGLRVVDPGLAAASLSIGSSPLTEREREVLAAAARGGSTSAVASALFLSEGTVRNHLSAAMGKLGVGSRAEAVRIATDNGWLG